MRLYSILTGTCPRCHQESMYSEKNPYIAFRTLNMNEDCSHCGLKYKIEPSFFYGAMYVSYGLGVALSGLIFIIMFSLNASLKAIFVSIVIGLVLMMPVIMRLSRNIWISFFIRYKSS